MGKMEAVLRTEIVRLAKKEVRSACQGLAREVRRLRRKVSGLSKAVGSLESSTARLAASQPQGPARLEADAAEVEKARLSPGLIKKLRSRLKISQAELAKLVGVSAPAVAFWEQGRSRPTQAKKSRIVALRGLGRRGVKRLLEAAE